MSMRGIHIYELVDLEEILKGLTMDRFRFFTLYTQTNNMLIIGDS